MSTTHAKLPSSRQSPGLTFAEHPTSGTADDDDDRDDEHDDENEAPVREVDENTETPEEFQVDNEDELGHPEDDGVDEEKDREDTGDADR